MAQAALEPGNPLYDIASTVDPTKVPEKLHCGQCNQFLLNAFKTTCCETAICENCNKGVQEECPLCKHKPFISNASKALRMTARAYLKSTLATIEAAKTTEQNTAVDPLEAAQEVAESAPKPEPQESLNATAEEIPNPEGQEIVAEGVEVFSGDVLEVVADIPVQSIEHTSNSRRNTMGSTSGNELDDDIEIHVGNNEEMAQPDAVQDEYFENYEQDTGERHELDTRGKLPENDYGDSFNPHYTGWSQRQNNQSTLMQSLNNSMQDMNPMNMSSMVNPQMMQMMMNNMQQMMGFQNMPGMNSQFPMMPNMQDAFNAGGFSGFPNQMFNMMANGNYQDFNPMFNNNNGYGQGQYQNSHPNNKPYSQKGNRARGKAKSFRGDRGGFRGNHHSYQDQFQNNYYDQMPPDRKGPFNAAYQHDNNYQNGSRPFNDNHTTNAKVADANIDDDDFAPAGQDEVREALGDDYDKSKQTPQDDVLSTTEERKTDKDSNHDSRPISEAHRSPRPSPPRSTLKEDDIPQAYREDLDYPMAPPTAPAGPSAKDYPYRSRGHARFPSRGGRGSYNLSNNGHPPSPARSLSQSQAQAHNLSPNSSSTKGAGVVGAPTGPKAMRDRDAPPAPAASRSNSDLGLKIMGRAALKSKEHIENDTRRETSPPREYSTYDNHDRDLTRRSKDDQYESRRGSVRYEDTGKDYEDESTHRKKKIRRVEEYDDDHDMQDEDDRYSRSKNADYKDSHKSSRRDRDKTKDKYSSSGSKHKSSRRYEGEEEQYDDDGYKDSEHRSYKSSKKSSKYDDRDERREKENERVEKDRYRKRSRHDREREEDYEDDDEEENRRRSRKHKKEHQSSGRRDRDDEYEDPDLGLRINGRSKGRHNTDTRTSIPTAPAATASSDKDPHTLEREKRNEERLLKEKQRREAAKGLSGGRKMNYKYEDDVDRTMSKSSRRR